MSSTVASCGAVLDGLTINIPRYGREILHRLDLGTAADDDDPDALAGHPLDLLEREVGRPGGIFKHERQALRLACRHCPLIDLFGGKLDRNPSRPVVFGVVAGQVEDHAERDARVGSVLGPA